MKHFISYLIVLSFVIGNFHTAAGQTPPKIPVDDDTKLVTYTEVIDQTGTKDELYTRAIMWFNSYYKNPQGVTKVRDKDNGKIEGRANLKVYNFDKDGNKSPAYMTSYTIKMDFKDGKYKYVITDFSIKMTSRIPMEQWLDKTSPNYTPQCDNYLIQIDDIIKDLIKKMKEGMKPKVEKKDDW